MMKALLNPVIHLGSLKIFLIRIEGFPNLNIPNWLLLLKRNILLAKGLSFANPVLESNRFGPLFNQHSLTSQKILLYLLYFSTMPLYLISRKKQTCLITILLSNVLLLLVAVCHLLNFDLK